MLTETRLTAAHLTTKVGAHRSVARILHEDYDDLHKQIHDVEWRIAAAERGKSSVTSMLGELADLGFAWRDIARLVNVSVPAVQKWRKGEKASGDSRGRIASLLAACDLIANHYMVDEIASWFEMPLSESAPITPITLYADNRADLVFEFASGHADPEALLSDFDPDWRERYRSDFEVFEAGDGNRSIRMKS
ncbi:transcriptional regulator [Mycolicibacter arupensis]|jgi:hypothetical protein|uniref:Uncharacterized protein n=2 Tax=Mycolicibacter arupensis TaxID=342002 RepID=A0A5C7YF33_9MYCO|nr:transcriptional regulator [Mycolicibacter arupensis]TXI60201.1 MAG: hypothetical protein E6Q54_00820 [Mycolicibacter arupensis]